MIPVTVQRGKQVHVLKVGQVILLPSGVEIRDFRAKAAGGALSQPAAPKKFETAEDELAARFGANWDGQTSANEDEPTEDDEFAAEALAAAKARRDKATSCPAERLLGPVSKKEKQEDAHSLRRASRRLAQVGGTETPGAQRSRTVEVGACHGRSTAWPSMDVDMTGAPTTALSRGSTLVIPAPPRKCFRIQGASGANAPCRVKKQIQSRRIRCAGARSRHQFSKK